MKKLVYTLSLVTLLSIAGKAQTNQESKPQDPKSKQPAPTAAPTTAPADEPKSRHAITQKGLPASKAKPAENKEQKAAEPKGQPTTEKH